MNYEQAFEALKRGEHVARDGRTLILRRGLVDVTDPDAPKQHYFSEEDRSAEDWEIATEETSPAVVSPEVVDEVLTEEIVPGDEKDEEPQ